MNNMFVTLATPHITCFVEAQCTLGEGPVWDKVRNGLWWVDIVSQHVYFASAAGQIDRHWPMPELIGFVIPGPDGQLWAGLKSGLHALHLSDNGECTIQRIDSLNASSPDIRFNDATADARGNLYATTMAMNTQQPLGAVVRYPATADGQLGTPVPIAQAFKIANGPTLSPDGGLLYMVESEGHPEREKGVWRASVRADGTLDDETHWLDWPYEGSPDGGTIDSVGNLWLGHYGGHTIRQFSPAGRLLQAIDLPVQNPTKVAFDPSGRLFVTSAREGASPEQLAQYPLTGSVLMVNLA